jgi:hypothetical protein
MNSLFQLSFAPYVTVSVSVGQFFGLCGSRSTQFPLALANNKV